MFTGEGRRDEDAKGKKEEGVVERRRMKRLGKKKEEGGRRGSVKECRRRERGK